MKSGPVLFPRAPGNPSSQPPPVELPFLEQVGLGFRAWNESSACLSLFLTLQKFVSNKSVTQASPGTAYLVQVQDGSGQIPNELYHTAMGTALGCPLLALSPLPQAPVAVGH